MCGVEKMRTQLKPGVLGDEGGQEEGDYPPVLGAPFFAQGPGNGAASRWDVEGEPENRVPFHVLLPPQVPIAPPFP